MSRQKAFRSHVQTDNAIEYQDGESLENLPSKKLCGNVSKSKTNYGLLFELNEYVILGKSAQTS